MEDHNGKVIVGADDMLEGESLGGASVALLFPKPDETEERKRA